MSLATNAVTSMAKTVALSANYLENQFNSNKAYMTDGLNSITLQQRRVDIQMDSLDENGAIPLSPLLLSESRNLDNFQNPRNE